MASNSAHVLRGVVNLSNSNPPERIGTTQVGHLEVLTMAPLPGEAAENGEAPTNPHPGRVILSRPFVSDEFIKRQLTLNSSDPAKEIAYRFEGINLIESICNAMQLPFKTFDAACTFYHKFRLNYGVKDYMPQDAAIACLFIACKCEDTLKKSREIICAAYNLRMPSEQRTPDDKIFDKPSGIVISLERMVLEAIAFDFRVRYPQDALVKILKLHMTREEAWDLYGVAYDMCYDMYRTFIPLKQATFGMAFILIELSHRLTGLNADKVYKEKHEDWHVTRPFMRAGMLDLLDLYTQHHKQTRLGATIDIDKFIEIKIDINKEVEAAGPGALPKARRPPPSVNDMHSVPFSGAGTVTNRFVFDAEEARREQEITREYFEDQFEEVEVEYEETIEEPERPRDRRDHGPGPGRGDRGHGGFRGQGHGHGHHGGRHGGGGGGWGGGRRDNRRRRGGGGGGFY